MDSRFSIYRDNLLEWNKVMNLTAIEDPDEVEKLHFLDSIALLDIADFKGKKVIDVGTGAGFPGLALKIEEDTIDLTLLDSLDKRLNFLKDTCEKLKISDVKTVHSRAEDISHEMRESFDIATSRAVAKLDVLSELCLPYVKVGGYFIAMKGPDFEEELNDAKGAIKLLGGKCEKCEVYEIPGTDIRHSAIVIKKVSHTDSKYPRKWAQIKKGGLK